MRLNGVGNEVRRQVRIVLFRHALVGMTELVRDDRHGNALLREQRPVRVPQHVEGNRRGNLGGLVSFGLQPVVAASSPFRSANEQENQGESVPAGAIGLKEATGLAGQDDMPWPAVLTGPRLQCADVRIESGAAE